MREKTGQKSSNKLAKQVGCLKIRKFGMKKLGVWKFVSGNSLYLAVRSGPPLPAGTFVLVNTGSTDVRVWRTGNQWGD
jgi:hypothetical protein